MHPFVLNVCFFEASHDECDVTQFSQLNFIALFQSGY